MVRDEASTSVMKWSEGLSNKVSIITTRYTDHTRCAAYVDVSLIRFFSYLLVLFHTVSSESRCALIKGIGSDFHEP
jgi:hypothetical protein